MLGDGTTPPAPTLTSHEQVKLSQIRRNIDGLDFIPYPGR